MSELLKAIITDVKNGNITNQRLIQELEYLDTVVEEMEDEVIELENQILEIGES